MEHEAIPHQEENRARNLREFDTRCFHPEQSAMNDEFSTYLVKCGPSRPFCQIDVGMEKMYRLGGRILLEVNPREVVNQVPNQHVLDTLDFHLMQISYDGISERKVGILAVETGNFASGV